MNIKEYKLHKIAAEYITGKIDKETISENANIKKSYYIKLINKCKELKESLENKDNLDHISKLIDEKRDLAIEFENITGIKWRL